MAIYRQLGGDLRTEIVTSRAPVGAKKSQYDPPYPSRSSVGPGGQQDQAHGVVQHVQGEGYQPPITSRAGRS